MSRIRPVRASELPAVQAVLRSVDLPVDDIDGSSSVRFWVAEEEGAIAGVVGLERAGNSALLRSLAVTPARRCRHLGRELVAHVEAEARHAGFRQLTLLTMSAEGFFQLLGYTAIERTTVAIDIRQTAQFRSLCPASAVCMTKTL